MGKTTVKPISLGYRPVGSQDEYVPLMGVLKGLSLGQDEPDSTEIDAEFYDSPFDIFYEGNPVTMTFELANYDTSELSTLFGGNWDEETEDYDGSAVAYSTEWEWKLNFSRGFNTLIIARGLTIGTIKKDTDGALNYSVTISALVYRDTSGQTPKDVMYKIKSADASPKFSDSVTINSGDATPVVPRGVIDMDADVETVVLSGENVQYTNPVIIVKDSDGEVLQTIQPTTKTSTTVTFSIPASLTQAEGTTFEVFRNASQVPWFKINV